MSCCPVEGGFLRLFRTFIGSRFRQRQLDDTRLRSNVERCRGIGSDGEGVASAVVLFREVWRRQKTWTTTCADSDNSPIPADAASEPTCAFTTAATFETAVCDAIRSSRTQSRALRSSNQQQGRELESRIVWNPHPSRPAAQSGPKLTHSALGTIFSTIGIALASSGGDKKEQAAPPAAKDDTSINTGNKEEDDL